ncbi:MAG: hypothetical protein AABN33_14995 [Acidobacteriota bacterium]
MSTNGPSEITAKASRGRPGCGFLGLLHAVALTAVVAGAGGSVGLMLRAGHPPLFLRVLFAIWVLSPFMALLLADMVSKRWSVITRATLHSVMLVITLSSLAIYGYVVLRPRESTPTFVFLVVPLGSWLLMTIVVPIAALISGRLSRRGAVPNRRCSGRACAPLNANR